MTPAKVWLLALPKVRVFAPSVTVLPATPARPPMVWLPAAEMSKPVPAPLMVTAPVGARLPPAPSATVPALIVRPPVKVLAPLRVRLALPFLVRLPAPEMMPETVRLLAPVSTVPPLAPKVTARLMVMVAVVCRVPPSSVRLPVLAPRLVSDEMARVPALTVQGVAVVVVPVSVQVLVPVLR
ncbi:hypothetical protein D9M73_93850 [compost metagenome]